MIRLLFGFAILAGSLSAQVAVTTPTVSSGINSVWSLMAGQLKHVSGSSDGQLWGVSKDNLVYRWNGSTWQQMPGVLAQVSAGSSQNIWGLAADGHLYKWNGSTWALMPGLLRQISAAADGTVVGTDTSDVIYRYTAATNSWAQMPGNGRLRVVSAGSAAEIWGVDPLGYVHRFNGAGWERKAGDRMATISVGADGKVLAINADKTVLEWNGSGWSTLGAGLVQVSVGAATLAWGTDAAYAVYTRSISSTSIATGSITVTGTTVGELTLGSTSPATNANTANIFISSAAQSTGQLVCTDVGSKCGTLRAENVGAYKLNMKCDSGFYDPIYGGTCWKCPDDDGYGSYIRSTTSVEKDTACWRVPKEHFGKAIRTDVTAWAWNCGSGTFWDPWDRGGCWKCPDDVPRRTAYAISSDKACASSLNETKPATLLAYSGCPKPDAQTMKSDGKLAGRTMPGKPFLDIGAGWNQGSASGACFTCPTIDTEGNFVITERNGNPIYNVDNQGCTIRLKYKPPAFARPGITQLNGAKEVVLQTSLLSHQKLTRFLHEIAIGKGMAKDSAQARAFVAQQWQAIAAAPYKNEHIRLLVLGEIMNAVGVQPSSRTPAQTALLQSFESFVTAWKTYLAKQGLNMYDAWKAWDDDWRKTHARHPVVSMFDYGTVPYDFHALISGLGTITATGGGILGATVAAFAIEANIGHRGLFALMSQFNFLKNLAQLKALAVSAAGGAAVITAVFAIITSVAMDQFEAIQSARPKLEAAYTEAQKPASLSQILAQPFGSDLVYTYWLMAMETTNETNDAQILQAAQAGYAAAKNVAFAMPQ